MRELYLIGCLVLGVGAVFATMSVVKYDYKETKQIPKDISFITPFEEEKEVKPPVSHSTEVIHSRNAFEESRGKEIAVAADDDDGEDDQEKGTYSFELRGINRIGEKKVALLTAQPVRSSKTSRSSRSSGRTTSPVTSNSNKVHIVALGEEIEDTGHKVHSIESGKVVITDGEGKQMPPLIFSLASDESLKRAELSYKNEVSRQKTFANQNKFPVETKPAADPKKQTPTATKPTDPKQMTKEQREAEMRKRAENLKAEMKRLKELREQDKNSKGSDKSKDKRDRK
ncbi:MAG: hypothetical protein NE328_23640 [Lentisphaeraceae bacterium]|nr:hypothetical protein [Lentisphaeraceae bacterium]